MATECSVCCEKYNKTTHAKIACEHACSFEACKACVRKYILGTTADPNCMQCNKAWSDKFLVQHLKAAFMRKEYKVHRTELLVQQQISRLPETMAAAEREKQTESLSSVLTDLQRQLFHAERRKKELRYASVHHCKSKEEKEGKKKEIDAVKETIALLNANIDQARHNLHIHLEGGNVMGEEKKEARTFIMPCGNTECRGYLSKQYKCQLCEHHTCAKCFEHIGLVKEGAHTCKPENIESAEYIKKQSKPCPCCGTRISKIDGCDQMWCTQCHKAFSWNTGKIVTGPVHNPHFFQYQREHGGLARNPADVVCGGLPIYYDINQKIATAQLPKSHQEFFYDTVTRIYRLQTHFTDTYVNAIRRNIPDEPLYERLRIRYILNKIDREEMAHKISRWDGDRRLNAGILHVCELFTTVGADMFRRILLSEKKGEEFAAELKAQVAEYDTLRLYVNEQLKEISMTYGLCIQQIKPDWTNDTSKFNSKGETDNYIIKREQKREARKEQEEAEHKAHQATLARQARLAAEAGAAIA
jgi:hypothetical protein